MAAAIPPAVLPRIGALLRMMASPVDGEALNAARALGRTLQGAGVDWHALADAVEHPTSSPTPLRRPRRSKPDHGHIDWTPAYRREVRGTLERGLFRLSLTPWERQFTTDIIARLRDPRGRLTFRQAEVVDRLVAKIEGRR
ncbi:hypothetical protein D3273_13475 [Lichenibacterium minor]|uniref:Uncharacterized protein n=1 Tax=Lichenibacterium minor TaxID=2316528 RepID=A0A4V1RUJ7_9HYPH|nr:hypothetical protein [Lichenibacterium minor]RYC31394.1 hypothetical protein D3273_13475 [Lichenibacterium minor]